MASLQALVLYITTVRHSPVTAPVDTLLALAIRLATKMNLNREDLSAAQDSFRFTTLAERTALEMRRRLWWHIIALDVQIAQDAGTEPVIWEGMWGVKMPSNLDDVELDAASELPLPPRAGERFDPDTYVFQNTEASGEQRLQHDRRTDVSFALLHIEMGYAMRRFAFSEDFCKVNGYEYLSTQAARVQFLENFMRSIDQRFLQFCNRNDMFSFFERNAAKLILSRHLMMARKDGSGAQVLQNCVSVLEAAAAMRKTHNRWAWSLRSYVELDTLELLWQILRDVLANTGHGNDNEDEYDKERLRHAYTLAEISFQRGKEDQLERCYGDKWARIDNIRNLTIEQRPKT
jgi:hypothetical protein